MKRKFAVLTVLGALVALAVPASSMGSMYPAGHKIEIAGSAPRLTTSLGSCPITKITSTIPAAPGNESGVSAPATVTVGTCSAGTSITIASESWKLSATAYLVSVFSTGGPETVVMRFTSLPGCKLAGGGQLVGVWSNGTTTPTLLKSGLFPSGKAITLTWANDGGSCGLAGKTEPATFDPAGPLISATVTDLTSPTTPVIVGNDK